MNLSGAWAITKGTSSVKVGIIDTASAENNYLICTKCSHVINVGTGEFDISSKASAE